MIGVVTYISDNNDSKDQDLENRIPEQGVSQGTIDNQHNSSDGSGGIELEDMGGVQGYGRGRASDSSRRPFRQ